jgi:hypothetical protein
MLCAFEASSEKYTKKKGEKQLKFFLKNKMPRGTPYTAVHIGITCSVQQKTLFQSVSVTLLH